MCVYKCALYLVISYGIFSILCILQLRKAMRFIITSRVSICLIITASLTSLGVSIVINP